MAESHVLGLSLYPLTYITLVAAAVALLPQLFLLVVSSSPVLSRIRLVRTARSSFTPIRFRYLAAIFAIAALALGGALFSLANLGPAQAQEATPPAKPADFTATSGDKQVVLPWTIPVSPVTSTGRATTAARLGARIGPPLSAAARPPPATR